jgi:hypothetical protein
MSTMKRTIAALSILSASTTAALFGACDDDDHNNNLPPQEPQGSAVPDAGGSAVCDANALNLSQSVVDEQGRAVANNAFGSADAVFLMVTPTDTAQPVIAQDFAFQVTDASGSGVSTDNAACRTFHIDASGTITPIATGTGSDTTCAHKFAVTSDGHSIIQLVPFENASTGPGTRATFFVQSLPACAGTQFPSTNVLQTSFTIPCGPGSGSD